MQQKNSPPLGPSFTLTDVYHILFRHKWKILSIWALGIAAATTIYATKSIPYRSRAELFIPYVLENRTPNHVGTDTLIKQAEEGGQSILNTEVEILNSFDLALEVASNVGPETILANVGGGSDRFLAAVWVRNGLTVEAPRRSTVVRVAYQHPDEHVVQPVLTQLIESYIKRHAEIHQSTSVMDDLLKRRTELLQRDLREAEESVRRLKIQMDVTDLKDAKKSLSDKLTDLNTRLSTAEVELAEQQAVLTQMTNASPNSVPKVVEAGTRLVLPPSEKTDAYRQICLNLANLMAQESNYIQRGYILTNEAVLLIREKIRNAQTLKEGLENEYPSLSGTRFETPGATPVTPAGPNIAGQMERVTGIEARVATLKVQIEGVRARSTEISNKESLLTELERKKETLENDYRSFSAKLEGSRIEDAVASSRIPNIKPIEMPTPAGKDPSRLYKKLGMLLAAAFGGGLALAFIIELLLDQTLRRPQEIPSRLGVALFLSIPITDLKASARLNGNGHKLLRAPAPRPEPDAGMAVAVSSPSENESENPPWKPNHELRPFFETLRDRLMMNFEVRNLTHNPKLVAVTGCSKDAGVSTIASGLAACLSETGEGNVLLVNMNDDAEQGAAHYFRNGKLECGLDDALEAGKRDSALVKDNLYVVDETAQAETLPQVFNKRFSTLLPRLRASDYDYVIFDMPTVTQTSPTPRLARFMDMVFVVVEAEKNDRNMVKRATDLLQESKATVGVVMNKTKNYLPRILQHDI